VCNYDRANLGQSGPAPKPRTTGNIADDLRALLTAARVPGPYLVVGGSAGGLYTQHFAARHPDGVVAVLAINPEVPADKMHPRLLPLLGPEDRAAEIRYGNGELPENTQGIDLVSSARQMAADGPLRVPLSILEATDQCAVADTVCRQGLVLSIAINRGLVRAAKPGGRYLPVAGPHDLTPELADRAAAEIDRLTSLTR
jgi:pimeloyl-ACP methyl ester carboxylesterase